MAPKPFFNGDFVLVDQEAPDKWALIERMIDQLMKNPDIQEQTGITREVLHQAVTEREEDRATGLADGFAFPHGRIPGFKGIGLCMAFLKTPLDFGAMDGKPATMVCMMVVPEEHPQEALKVMAQFARMVSDPADLEVLTKVTNPESMSHFLSKRLFGKETIVTARDLMRTPRVTIYPDTPIREVTRAMHQHILDAVSVTDKEGRIVGEITCEQLFQVGMPDFFRQLKSISFIREFDPFEKYYESERETLASDVMSTDYATVEEDATLLEIVFELAVKSHSKVHVVRDGKRIGVIDRILVLDKVINI